MNTIAALFRPVPFPSMERLRKDPAAQAFSLMRIGFFLLPLLMGIDKYAKVMQSDWPQYLAHAYNDIIPGSGQEAMYIVGGVEIAAGIILLILPRFGSLLVAGWLGGIIASLVIVGGYGDIALRDIALMLLSLSLFRLSFVNFADSHEREAIGSHNGHDDTISPRGPGVADPLGQAHRVG